MTRNIYWNGFFCNCFKSVRHAKGMVVWNKRRIWLGSPGILLKFFQISMLICHELYIHSWEWHQANTTQSLLGINRPWDAWFREAAGSYTALTWGGGWAGSPGCREVRAPAGDLIWAPSAKLGPGLSTWESLWNHLPPSTTGIHRPRPPRVLLLGVCQNHLAGCFHTTSS